MEAGAGGRSLARGAAAMTVASAISRVTGFVRVVVVAAAMGTTFLANTYQTANTAPNVIFELVAAGVLTSVFVPTFVDYIVRDEREQGWHAANVLGSVALAALLGLALLLALTAPLAMRLLTIGVEDPELRSQEIALGATFLRLFAPQVIFYGAGMIMTAALHAHRRFGIGAVAPIFNNVVVIGVYLTYAAMRADRPPTVSGITGAETLVLGAGTTLGVVAMTVSLIPQLRRLGWRFRWRFYPAHPAVAKAARLGVWALGYAGGYQAGLIVVLMLANRVEGGVAAYQWAYTFFYVPHALFAVPLANVLFPAMSEHVARREEDSFLARLREGLGMLAFILLPTAAFLVMAAEPVARLTLQYGAMTREGAELVGRVLAAFAVGLPTYSAFLTLTRSHYALGDTRSPALVNAAAIAVASASGVGLFMSLPPEWRVPGLALGHSIGFALGTVALSRLLSSRFGHVGTTSLTAALVRSLGATLPTVAVMALVRALVPDAGRAEALVAVATTAASGALVYLGVMKLSGSQEMARITALVTRARA
ncbi:MAG: murein biosynthesis integral membrane protein MurJ [Actinomycetota bacterium]